MKSTNC